MSMLQIPLCSSQPATMEERNIHNLKSVINSRWRAATDSIKMTKFCGHFENVVSFVIPAEPISFLVSQEETGFKKICSAHVKPFNSVLQFPQMQFSAL
ncbi:hypothetical protein AVEN_100789-1 [Araneus ventricosus]|uniref:Uncharacterized protein n=1 Tax=Araneus ventricosus TaxID=182803 RepID=A0A4Y2AVX0_ARAVE|nr:hypothetical protein AVEN_100789-1 [Araneus ventricosus]